MRRTTQHDDGEGLLHKNGRHTSSQSEETLVLEGEADQRGRRPIDVWSWLENALDGEQRMRVLIRVAVEAE